MSPLLLEHRKAINDRWETLVRESVGRTRIRVGADCYDLVDGRWTRDKPLYPEPTFPAMPTTRGFEYTIWTHFECWLYLDDAGNLRQQEVLGGAYEAKPGVVPAFL